jgi:hypothetical protein
MVAVSMPAMQSGIAASPAFAQGGFVEPLVAVVACAGLRFG